MEDFAPPQAKICLKKTMGEGSSVFSREAKSREYR
jgi:hypothetical protein